MPVIGVVGLNGSGKDEVVKYLNQRYIVPYISIGDVVRELAARTGIEPTRDNLDALTQKSFREYGEGHFVKLVASKIRENGWRNVGLSGIRSPADIAILRQAFGRDFILIAVSVSDPRVRYERVHRRGSTRDHISYADFLRQDEAGEQLFHIRESSAQAEYSLTNDGNLDGLHSQVDELVKKGLLRMTMDRAQLAKEIYTVSHITGTFILRSGQISNRYFDKYLFEARPDLLAAIADHMAQLIPAGTGVLAGLELGGVPVAAALSLRTGLPAAFVRKKAKDYGTCKLAEGASVQGRQVCVIEDVITTGGQVILSAHDLRNLGAKVENVMCVILRGANSREILGKEGLNLIPLFTMEELEAAR